MFGKPGTQPNLFGGGFGQNQPQTSNQTFGSAFGPPNTYQPSNQPVFCLDQPLSQSAFGVSPSQAPQQPANLFGVSQPQSEPQASSFGSNQAQAMPASSSISFSAPSNTPQSEPQASSFGSYQAQAKPASSSLSFAAPSNTPGFGSVGGFGKPNPAICFGTPAPAYPFGFIPNVPPVRRYPISAYNPARKLRHYSYYITIENAEYKADAHIIINSQDHFKLSSALLSQNCEFFARELKSESELSIDLPTQSFIYEFFLYLNYRYAPDLLDKITSLQDILDLYILLHKFEYKHAETLLEGGFSNVGFKQPDPLSSYFPKELHRDYISFDFCIRLARNFSRSVGFFGTPSNFYSTSPAFLAYLLIWLGFDAIRSRQELSDLLNSEDCQKVKEYIELYELYPSDQDQLNSVLHRFPEAISMLNHDKLLKKLGVI